MNDMSIYNYHLFDGFTADDFHVIENLLTEKRISEGSTVYLENMPGEALYIIKSGTIRITKMLGEGEERTLVILGGGDCFGEMALLDGSARAATARVLEQVDLIIFRKADFDNLCILNPGLSLKIVKNIVRAFCDKLHKSNHDVKDFIFASLR